MTSQSYELREMSVEDVAAKDLDTRFQIKGGKSWYERAMFSDNPAKIRVSRIMVGQTVEDGVKQTDRYIDRDTLVLVEMNEAARIQLNEL